MRAPAQPVLIVGAGGQLAWTLAQTAPKGTVCMGRTRVELDITDANALARTLDQLQPSLLFNGAAYNLVDRAEGDGMEAALRVNALGVARLAAACRRVGTRLVHFSTDLVFDGAQETPYYEHDLARPLSVYGASKLAGEHVALAADPSNLVVRVCRLFGPAPPARLAQKPVGNFPLLMRYLAAQQGKVRVVNDQLGSPSYLPDVARAVWELAATGQGGLFHLSNSGAVTFAEYAQEIFRLSKMACDVEAVSSAEYGAAAGRPRYSVLSNAKAHMAGVTPLRPWQDALKEFLLGSLTTVV